MLSVVYSELVLPKECGKDTACGPNDVADSMERHGDDFMWTASDTRPSLVDIWYVVLDDTNVCPSIVGGFVFGMTCQGLRYTDCFQFMESNPWASD